MGHIFADITLIGQKGENKLREVMVDTGATYTILPLNAIKEIGPFGPLMRAPLTLGDGRKVEAEGYAMRAELDGREGPIIVATFKGAKSVIGVQTLEALGLKANPVTGKLEPTRSKKIMGYFY